MSNRPAASLGPEPSSVSGGEHGGVLGTRTPNGTEQIWISLQFGSEVPGIVGSPGRSEPPISGISGVGVALGVAVNVAVAVLVAVAVAVAVAVCVPVAVAVAV